MHVAGAEAHRCMWQGQRQVAGAEAKRRRTLTKRLSVSSCSPTASTQHQQPLTGASHLGKAPVHLLLAHCKAAAPRTFAKRLRIPSCSSTAETQSHQPTRGCCGHCSLVPAAHPTRASHLCKAPVRLLLLAPSLLLALPQLLVTDALAAEGTAPDLYRTLVLRRGRAGVQLEVVQQTAAAVQQHTGGMQGVQCGGVQQTAQLFQGHEGGTHQVQSEGVQQSGKAAQVRGVECKRCRVQRHCFRS